MRLKFLFIGRTRQPYLAEGISDYLNRIKQYLPVEQVVLKETKVRNAKEAPRIRAQDTTFLLTGLKPEDVFVLLDPNGRAMTSLELADWLKGQMNRGVKTIAFGLGGPLGLDRTANDKADLCLSLSRMTLTHEMSRLVLLEQIFRALRINAGHPYHK
ncbi:MAG: 23S rRNA (pseudouridine(1915)-N(3))-methyltransferase RlmH [Deltaproteobacteria bacterium]|nr:23S rRNA (pseudouridine(1915)-N(3))-methyltransferase RlmH [Deltaproteobacteria bacterium]